MSFTDDLTTATSSQNTQSLNLPSRWLFSTSTPSSPSLNASIYSDDDSSSHYNKLEESAQKTISRWRSNYEKEKTKAERLNKLLVKLTEENQALQSKLKRSEASSVRKERMDPESSMMRRLLVNLHLRTQCVGNLDSTLAEQKEALGFIRHWTGVETPYDVVRQALGEHQTSRRGIRPAFSISEWLLIYIIRTRHGINLFSLSGWTEQSMTTVGDNLARAEALLNSWALRQIRLPSIEEWKAASSGSFTDAYPNSLWFFIDGTYVPIFKSTIAEVQKECWNGKHKMHALVFTILVMVDGSIVWLSRCDLGNKHDTTAWTESGGPEQLQQEYAKVLEREATAPTLAICGDEAYCRASIPPGWKVHVTMSAVAANDPEGESENVEAEPISLNVASSSTLVQPAAEASAPLASVVTNGRKKGKRFSKRTGNSSSKKSANQQRQEAHAQNHVHKALPNEVVLDGMCAKFRAVVERTFARIKTFLALHNKLLTSRNVKSVHNMITIICGLVNYDLRRTKHDECNDGSDTEM